ncbi:dolichyl-phosphate beta-glucosyltransferase [Besnoitia besnoiti]|uniref:Dolichyl-phosphate beta-glucosyltransferase n=1 Tax=Besnoitia besnoiti TaxID=94643 RepID=A0A2A9M8R1_BESBE|nr:dolichyl-phosphate beta-glucosyltransferase [Besnoitia besnoiti]PFH34868.1 dolichyl-phosphate beta-glucosyltransferase [Besnoitia besnoiti]
MGGSLAALLLEFAGVWPPKGLPAARPAPAPFLFCVLLAAALLWAVVKLLLWLLEPLLQWQQENGKPPRSFLLAPLSSLSPGAAFPSCSLPPAASPASLTGAAEDLLQRPPSVDLTVVVPAFNEALRLPVALAELLWFLEARRAASGLSAASCRPASSLSSSLLSSPDLASSARARPERQATEAAGAGGVPATASRAPSAPPDSSASTFWARVACLSPPAGLLEQAVERAPQSPFFTYEIIVVDDGSSDGTCDIPGLLAAAILSPSSSPSAGLAARAASAAFEEASRACGEVHRGTRLAEPSRQSAACACPDASSFSSSFSLQSSVATAAVRAAAKVHLRAQHRLAEACPSPEERPAEASAEAESEAARNDAPSPPLRGEGAGVPASSPLAAVRLLRLKTNQGKGFAVKLGAKFARGRLLLMADADAATPVEGLVLLERALAEKGRRTLGTLAANDAPQTEPGAASQAHAAAPEVCDGSREESDDGASERGSMHLPPSASTDATWRVLCRLRAVGDSGDSAGEERETGEASGEGDDGSASSAAWRTPLVAFGSRRKLEKAAIASRSWHRNFLMHAFHWCVRVVVGDSRVKDTQCGFKLFTRAAARTLFPRIHLRRWAFDVELLLLARKLRVPVAEVPVAWLEKEGSKLHVLRASFQMARDILLLKCMYAAGIWKA